jgi:hypothetical protein
MIDWLLKELSAALSGLVADAGQVALAIAPLIARAILLGDDPLPEVKLGILDEINLIREKFEAGL